MALATMESILLKSGRVLTEEANRDLRQAYFAYRAGLNRLSEWALSSGLRWWPLRPKNHYIEHWVLDTCPLNGRCLHNYLQEDLIRRIKMLAAKSHPAFLSKHVTFKYVLQTTLRWRGGE